MFKILTYCLKLYSSSEILKHQYFDDDRLIPVGGSIKVLRWTVTTMQLD